MPDARAKRRRQRRQEQLEAADLEKVSGFAVKTHMVTGAAIGGVAALVLANVRWPEKSYVLTPQETAMTLGGGALGAFIMGCRKILGNLEADAPTEARHELRRARLQGIAGGVVARIALAVAAILLADRPMQIIAGLAAISVCPFTGYAVWPVVILIVELIRRPDPKKESVAPNCRITRNTPQGS